MSDETKIVTPDAPRNLTWVERISQIFPPAREMDPVESAAFDNLVKKHSKRLYTEAQMKSEREYAVREFAHFLETTASPKGTVQREELQGFATEFLAYPIEEHTPND